MAETIFSKIVAGTVPCHRVYEDAQVLAFLDVNPLAEGHTLVIPKRAVERFEDLTPDEAAALARAIGPIARKVLSATGAADYNLLQNNGGVSGQVVMHVHFHIIPRRAGDGLGYRWLPKPGDPAALAALAERVRQA
jgi:histidine triad (HIT) family protein